MSRTHHRPKPCQGKSHSTTRPKTARASDKPPEPISGLVLRLAIGDVVYLNQTQTSVNAKLTLLATRPKAQKAEVLVTVAGGQTDLANLGERAQRALHGISATRPTEVLPGVLVAVRREGGKSFVGPRSASLIISADRRTWTITREQPLGSHTKK